MTRVRPAAPAIELLSIGDELMLGETVDTNAAWLSRRLADAGIQVPHRATVGDDERAIRAAAANALERTGAVICTGGLGPTPDDRTRPVIADLFGRELSVDEGLLDSLRQRFASLGRRMADTNRVQAEVPDGALVLANPRGTAPGLVLEREDGTFAVLLPGVPREMRGIFDEALLPWLERRWPEGRGRVRHHLIRTSGIAESELAERLAPVLQPIDDLKVAFLPDVIGVDVRLTSDAALSDDEAEARFTEVDSALCAVAGDWVYGRNEEDLVDAVAARLRRHGWTLAVAESCTGGLVGKRLTDRAGASDFVLGGVIAYADRAKTDLLGVRVETVEAHGAVSEAVASEMAEGAARRFGAHCAIAVTGVAGPGGGTERKPVGTVCIAARAGKRARVITLRLPGDRQEVRERSAQAALALLWKLVPEADE